jgi:glutaredoxin
MEKIIDGWVIISKENCTYCDMSIELFNNNFIEFNKLDYSIFTNEEINNIKTNYNIKSYPFIYKDKKFIGGYRELKNYLQINNNIIK